jgi:autotransporter-associated beta strand protein
MKKLLVFLSVSLIVCSLIPSARAAALIWDNQGLNGYWNDGTNWGVNADPNFVQVPTSFDTCIFRSSSPAGTITFTNDGFAARIRQQAGAAGRTLVIDPGETVDRKLTMAGAAELFDFSTADSALTMDGTANGNGARLKLQIDGTGTGGTVINGAGSLILNLDVSGAGGFILNAGTSGGGTLVLGGANTYTGVTTVNAGKLLVNGSTHASSVVTVQTGGTIGGTGTVGGPATIADGIVAPGASAGTLPFGSDLNLASTSVLKFELDGTDQTVGGGVNDLIVVLGNLTLDGTLDITALGSFAGASVGDKWRIFDYSGILTDNGLVLGTSPDSNLTFAIDTLTPNQVNLVVTAVPEPSTLLLGLLGGMAILIILRRRQSA